MMESSNLNLDLHHQEEYFHGSSNSSLTSPLPLPLPLPLPFHFVGRNHDWNNQDLPLNSADNFMRLSHDTMPTVQELGFQYGTTDHQEGSGYMIKEELGFDPVMGGFGRGSFGMVPPTPNISGLNPLTSSYPSSLGMDVQALDLLASGRFGRMLCQPTMDTMAYGIGQLQEPAQHATQIKISHTISGSVSNQQAHRPNGDSLEYKASQSVAKKPRFESRASFTPFKVRKEKLGDRIAALQQLVAPFGKTDTASVLMEAIGYIKFLQDQVETLSVPYMRSSNTKKTRTSGEASSDEREEAKVDLRSRGLCLVPLSCTSYVTNENGGVWSPPNYRGGGT